MDNFIEEMKWRGMIHDMTPKVEEQLLKESTTAYIGFDPTADSMHIGNLVQIAILRHLQKHEHTPIALIGGATGMIGDPSGKSIERSLLDEETLQRNQEGVKKQLEQFLDFEGKNAAQILNNYDWFKEMLFLEFIRDVGKHITVNYMMAKDSVKRRLETGISFTEFTYQLVQGYDFYWLWKNKGAKIQFGGSDQWGNIVTGTELIRRMGGGEAYAITTPLITKADGTKFGKSENENIWLDKSKTSPYKFYQYWINASDEDIVNWIKIFSEKSKEEITALIEQHNQTPHVRILQKKLAEELTVRIHSEEDFQKVVKASNILFGNSTKEDFEGLEEELFLQIFEDVPSIEVSMNEILQSNSIDILVKHTNFLSSNGEARRAIKENSISVNKVKIKEDFILDSSDIILNQFVILQKGKKNYFVIKVK